MLFSSHLILMKIRITSCVIVHGLCWFFSRKIHLPYRHNPFLRVCAVLKNSHEKLKKKTTHRTLACAPVNTKSKPWSFSKWYLINSTSSYKYHTSIWIENLLHNFFLIYHFSHKNAFHHYVQLKKRINTKIFWNGPSIFTGFFYWSW